ncbi:MAG: RagB/SusD family nutrient uptake outer membrane protein [Tannerellaceae bacterium]|nr:RagB/SusD family nutrient uptake outer membrane protein [Tannerellaceae bacterium]
MKKNFYLSIILSVCMLPTLSCSDYLDTVPFDKASPDTFLSDIEQARSLLAGIYNCFYDDSPNYMYPYTLENMCDNSFNPNTWESSTEIGKGTHTSTSWWPEYKWTKDWQAISRANSLIRGLNGSNNLTQAEITAITAETRFLRAWFYFDLVTFYGRVPLLDEDSPLENPAREEIEEVMNFAYADVEFAINNLPHLTGGEYASKGSAYMLKMRMAQYEYDHQTVIDCAKAIEELGFSLYPDFQTLFLEDGNSDPSNKEVILKINYATDILSSNMTMLWYHWSSFHTTLDLVDCFFTANGLPIKDLVAEDGGTIQKDYTYNPDRPFNNRDPRLHLSILCPGYEYRLDAESRYQEHWIPSHLGNLSGFRPKKGANPYLENTNNDGNDKILMRYGEVLLARAEAENELNGPANAYPLIDQLRERVGMVTLSESLPGLTKSTMRELIRNERRIELFHEGQRYLDIRRWGIAEKVMVDAIGLDVSLLTVYTNGDIQDKWKYESMVIDKRTFNKNRDYLWPIPQKEINANPAMKGDQNPNY